jgi:hypothetical protein
MTDINPAAGRALRSLRKIHEGRPAVYHKCPHCTGDYRAKDIRHHKAGCEKNPTMPRRIRTELSEHPAVDMPSEK